MTQFRLTTAPYKLLFQVKCEHGYYRNGICPDFSYRPTPACEQDLRNCQLVFKETDSGFVVLYHGDRTPPILRIPSFRPSRLSFLIQTRNRQLFNFSDLPFPVGEGVGGFFPEERCYRLDNMRVEKSKTDETLLHSGASLPAQHDRPYLVPVRFPFSFPQPIAYAQIDIRDAFDRRVELPSLPAYGHSPEAAAQAARTRHDIDLSAYPMGRYRLMVPGGEPFDCYTSDKNYAQTFAIVDIYLGEEVAAPGALIDAKGGLQPRTFTLRIAPRATYWKYILVNQRSEEVAFSGHSIEPMKLRDKAEQKGVKFAGPEEITLRNGYPATLMTSEAPIPLREIAEDIFELHVKMNGRRTRAPIKLPIPDTNLVLPDSKDPAKMYSEMYVYL
ncbi:MAG: hypothetical protein OHK0039_16170 [Bacteroidia bacterium]